MCIKQVANTSCEQNKTKYFLKNKDSLINTIACYIIANQDLNWGTAAEATKQRWRWFCTCPLSRFQSSSTTVTTWTPSSPVRPITICQQMKQTNNKQTDISSVFASSDIFFINEFKPNPNIWLVEMKEWISVVSRSKLFYFIIRYKHSQIWYQTGIFRSKNTKWYEEIFFIWLCSNNRMTLAHQE